MTNKKKLIIAASSIAVAAVGTAVMLTLMSKSDLSVGAYEEKTTAGETSALEEITIKPIPVAVKTEKPEETEALKEETATETEEIITLTPDEIPIEDINIEIDPSEIPADGIVAALPAEAPEDITDAPSVNTVNIADWSVVDDGGILGAGWGDNFGKRSGEVGYTGGDPIVVIGA